MKTKRTMNIYPISRNKKFLHWLATRLTLLALVVGTQRLAEAQSQSPPPLFTCASSFAATNHYVAVSVFVWFAATGGQLSGPWRPLEGRSNWTGLPDWWQGQIKQMMMANIDVLYVHLYNDPNTDQIRVNLFNALNQLRAQGYDTPKVAPFLDPTITWYQQPLVDLATTAGKDTFVGQYIRFYNEYYSVNTDPYADDYLARQANKPVLDTWHVQFNCANLTSLTRTDVSSRLVAAFGGAHPCFTNGFVMVTTALNPPTLSFADEQVPQFEITAYYYPVTYNSISSVQLKGGYWDQNIRSPGSFLARAGGVNYSNAWSQVDRTATQRIYLESWNEYDEGSGLYVVTNLPPYIAPANTSGNTDVWSTTGDPSEYIKTTARGAASFNDTPLQSAKILWHNIPSSLAPGETRIVTVVVRNTGNASWTAGANYKLGQADADTASFVTAKRVLLNDTQDEIPLYGGIFRGRPKTFTFTIKAPTTSGVYTTHWQMLQENVAWFGEVLPVTINVVFTPLEAWQLQYFGCTNCAQAAGDADPDGDGMRNTNEFLAGFCPTNSAAYPHIISLTKAGNDMKVTYLGANGDNSYTNGPASRTNVLEYTSGTADGSYTNNFVSTGQTNILSGGTGLGIITNMVESGGATNTPSRYYRVRVLVP